jgi:hypothetical protein
LGVNYPSDAAEADVDALILSLLISGFSVSGITRLVSGISIAVVDIPLPLLGPQ